MIVDLPQLTQGYLCISICLSLCFTLCLLLCLSVSVGIPSLHLCLLHRMTSRTRRTELLYIKKIIKFTALQTWAHARSLWQTNLEFVNARAPNTFKIASTVSHRVLHSASGKWRSFPLRLWNIILTVIRSLKTTPGYLSKVLYKILDPYACRKFRGEKRNFTVEFWHS